MNDIAEHYRHIMRYYFYEGLKLQKQVIGFMKFMGLMP